MKRNFYALFALLTALSGPLVMAPQAVSKPNTECCASNDQFEDDQAKDGATAARIEQQHNQPPCQFMVEDLAAPEDLVVLPEDFDYEMYAEQETCENKQNDGSGEDLTGGTEALASEMANSESLNSGLVEDPLCLPESDWLPNAEPWDGPAIAGFDPIESISSENLEAELPSPANGCWAANLVARSSYALASTITSATVHASEEVVRGIRSFEEFKIQKTRELLGVLESSTQSTLKYLTDWAVDLSQGISSESLTLIQVHQAERPFCHCWAMPELGMIEEPDASSDEPPPQNQLDWAAEEAATSPTNETEALPEVPSFQVQLNSTDALQNDAVMQPQTSNECQVEPIPTVDFQALGEAAKQAWEFMIENAAMVDRWSRDYDFEPFSAEELERRESAE